MHEALRYSCMRLLRYRHAHAAGETHHLHMSHYYTCVLVLGVSSATYVSAYLVKRITSTCPAVNTKSSTTCYTTIHMCPRTRSSYCNICVRIPGETHHVHMSCSKHEILHEVLHFPGICEVIHTREEGVHVNVIEPLQGLEVPRKTDFRADFDALQLLLCQYLYFVLVQASKPSQYFSCTSKASKLVSLMPCSSFCVRICALVLVKQVN